MLWPLTDNQGTVRDVALLSGTTTSVVDHIIYSSFGGVVSESNRSQGCLFKYTGRPTDPATGLQHNLNRWYDAVLARWTSPDPTSFTGGDTNLYRYCGNSPTNAVDPAGMSSNWMADERRSGVFGWIAPEWKSTTMNPTGPDTSRNRQGVD